MDTYRDMQDVEDTFVDFMDRVPFYGMLVVCNDDDPLRLCCRDCSVRYGAMNGTRAGSDFRLIAPTTELEPGSPKPRAALGSSTTASRWGNSACMFRERITF